MNSYDPCRSVSCKLTHSAPVSRCTGYLVGTTPFCRSLKAAQASRCSARKQRKRVTVDVNRSPVVKYLTRVHRRRMIGLSLVQQWPGLPRQLSKRHNP